MDLYTQPNFSLVDPNMGNAQMAPNMLPATPANLGYIGERGMVQATPPQQAPAQAPAPSQERNPFDDLPPYAQRAQRLMKQAWESSHPDPAKRVAPSMEYYQKVLAEEQRIDEQRKYDEEKRGLEVQKLKTDLDKTKAELSVTQLKDFDTAQKAIDASDYMLATIDKVRGHAGRADATGKSRMIPWNSWGGGMDGTPAKGFNTELETLSSQTFLEARQLLKGAGQITDFEGGKAEKAAVNLNPGLADDEFAANLDEYRTRVQRARDNAAKFKTNLEATLAPKESEKPAEKAQQADAPQYKQGVTYMNGSKKMTYLGGEVNSPKSWRIE